MTTLGIAKEHAPVGCNTVVDNRPSLLGERVCLDASVDQVDRLSRANERAVGLSLDELLLCLLERLVRMNRLLEGFAKLVRQVRSVLSETLGLPIHGRAAVETGLVGVGLIVNKQLRKNTDGLEPSVRDM